MLGEQRPRFEQALARIHGHEEWGVKMFRAGGADDSSDQPAPTSGREYLARRSEQARTREESANRRQAVVLEVHEALAHAATHAVVNAPQDSALSGRREPMTLNAAYLVARHHRDEFLELAEALHDRVTADGLTLEVTGPWPAYNFAHLPDSSTVGAHDDG